jgi:hypothetical protein
MDPLEFDTGDVGENYYFYKQLCDSNAKDWQAKKLIELEQQRQQDWVALWVGQMTRIAKPGAPVIIESVAPPYCVSTIDWGGIATEWWKFAAATYDWGVDPESLEIGPDLIFDGRHHVFMRKKEVDQ